MTGVSPRDGEQLDLLEPVWCQRWSNRRPGWRRTSKGGFDPTLYRCVALEAGPARRFVERHHYSGSWPAVRMAFGMQLLTAAPGAGEPDGGRLVGVLALGVPMARAVLTRVFPSLEPYRESVELSRLVLLDEVPSNGESWMCAASFALAAGRGVRGVVAYSDPHPRFRVTLQGREVVTPGHVGHVYAAQDFAYLGRSRARRLVVLPDGTVLTDRAAMKVRRDESGHHGVERRLRVLGARPREAGEPGGRWLEEALEAIGAGRLDHGGNHLYARSIGARRTSVTVAPTAYPAPKRHTEALSMQYSW
ncbi:Mom family adenine methylcarbamoylation protein [Kitasatospora sp. NPDC003701]